MPWNVVKLEHKSWYQSPFVWVGVALFGSMVLLAMPHAQQYYRGWSKVHHVNRAAKALANKDYKQAILDARIALAIEPLDVEATRIVAKALEEVGLPEAVQFRRQLESIRQSDTENSLSMAADCLKASDVAAAERALGAVKPEDRNSVRFHDLAATIAWKKHDGATAELHWTEALKLVPNEHQYQFMLALVRLGSKSEDQRKESRQALEQFKADPEWRLAALRALLNDASTHGDRDRARQLTDELAADPQATLSDKITRLTLLHAIKDPEFPTYLGQLQELAAATPPNIFLLATWMNEHNLALLVPEWEAKLPPETVAKPPACAAFAEAYALGSNWDKLKEKVETTSWSDLEFLRFAYLSRALERLSDPSAANAAWTKALMTAEAHPEWLEVLAKTILGWRWQQRAEDTLWKLSAGDRCPRWAIDFLWSASEQRRDSASLLNASKLMLKADPKNVPARNNFITLSLLTHQESGSPNELAQALYEENSDDPVCASTYGLSLYLHGKYDQAVAIMNKFPAERLQEPVVALYYGIFLAASGESDKAERYLQAGVTGPMLPEERAIVERVATGANLKSIVSKVQ